MDKFHFYNKKEFAKQTLRLRRAALAWKGLVLGSVATLVLAGAVSASGFGGGFLTAPHIYAAEAPAFSSRQTSLYENDSHEGVYTYSVKNLKKGYKIKWSLSGPGAPYLTLKRQTTTAASSKSYNKIFVDTLGSREAKNKKAALTAHVYDTKGKLVRKVTDNFTIRVNSTYIQIKTGKITDSLNSLPANKSYDFDCAVSPANTTSKLYWKVKDASGKDCPGAITSDGVWTPKAEGDYSIYAYTKNSDSGRVITKTILPVTVGTKIKTSRQTAADGMAVTFTSDMKGRVSLSDFSLTYIGSGNSFSGSGTNGVSVPLKELSLSEDGKTVTLKTMQALTHESVYRLDYKGMPAETFTASVGRPVSGVILTTEALVNTYHDIKYALYDANGIDVTSIYNYNVTFSGTVPSGYVSSSGSLFMDIVGEYASVTMTFQNESETFTIGANILCTAEGSSNIRTTVSSSTSSPVYGSSTTVSENSFYLGDTAYLHFEVLDEQGAVLPCSNISYISQDSSILSVSNDGKLTGQKAGTALVYIYCSVDNKYMNYRTNITVLPRRTPSQLMLSDTSITVSNAQDEHYKTELTVTAYDQYQNKLNQSAALATIREENNKPVLASYDADTGKITISAQGAKPGVYTYHLSLLLGGTRVTTTFTVTVQAVPETGIETWKPEASTILADTDTVTAASGPLTLKLRLAHYINGIFASYAPLQSATVKTSDGWHSDDLTVKASEKARKIYPQDNEIVLTAAYWPAFENAAVKANPGVYTVTLKYYAVGTDGESKLESTQTVFVVE